LEDGRSEGGARAIRTGSPERSVGEILDFKDSSETFLISTKGNPQKRSVK
jgi:hypothetical protein